MKASGAGGRGRVGRGEAESFFPSEGNFNTVVPLSEGGEQEQEDETTLVPARGRKRHAHEPHARRRFEQSWAFLAAAVVLSAVAGAAAGIYVLKWQSPAETARTGPPAAAVVDAEAAPTPQPSEPAPQPERDSLAAEPVSPAPPVVTAAPREAETKVEKVNASERPTNVSRQAAEPPARRAAEDEPRAQQRPARAARQESAPSPAPRLQRAEAAPPRAVRNTPATVNPPARPSLVSSPPPSAKPNKVIKWP